jgi:hypothetical protein
MRFGISLLPLHNHFSLITTASMRGHDGSGTGPEAWTFHLRLARAF